MEWITVSAAVLSTSQSNLGIILAMKVALKSTSLTSTFLACTHQMTDRLTELANTLEFKPYQYSQWKAIFHSFDVRSEHVVRQQLHDGTFDLSH